MGQTEQFQFTNGFPMEPLKKTRVLVLDRCEKFAATESMSHRYRLIDQAGSESAEAAVYRQMIPYSDTRAQSLDASELARNPEPAPIPDTRFPFIDSDNTDHQIIHARDERLADDWDRPFVDFVSIGPLKYPLFFTKDRTAKSPITLQLKLGAPNFKYKILRSKTLIRIKDHFAVSR
jgi:hypothetical protein